MIPQSKAITPYLDYGENQTTIECPVWEFQRVDYVQNGMNYVAYLRVK
jgi:hypothetical protein